MQIKENEGQAKAVEKTEGQLVIVACPGSGKTTTLVSRIHRIIEGGVEPQKILMMTFSKAAAEEMTERYVRRFGENPGVTFSTIHAFCFAVLRKFFGYTQDSVMRETERYGFLRETVRAEKRIPSKDREEFITALSLDISNVKNSMSDPWDIEPKCCSDRGLFADLYGKYIEYGRETGKIDFDDMLVKTLLGLRERPDVVEWLRAQYEYIQVDEYQDTNLVQAEIIYLIAGEHGNLAVVGDDDQSIYGFRGADPSVMLDFTERYPDAEKVFLSTNYRSRSEIIEPSKQLISKNKNRFKKEFECERGGGGSADVERFLSRNDQLEALASRIKALIESGVEPSEIAVLYRTNRQADLIAGQLMDAEIPFHSTEAVKTRYESWVYEDVMAYREAAVKKSPAVISRIMNHPQRFFPSDMAGCRLDRDRMYAVAHRKCTEKWKEERCRDAVDNFTEGMALLGKKDSPLDGLKVLTAWLDYGRYIEEYAAFRGEDPEDYLGALSQFSDDIRGAGIKTWDAWRAYAQNYARHARDVQKEAGKDSVTLSTMHKAKGLEWKHVFIVDATKRKCPFKGPGSFGSLSPKEKEEERRLFYVAATRAKDCLHVMYYGTQRDASPFIKEMRLTEAPGGGSLAERIGGL